MVDGGNVCGCGVRDGYVWVSLNVTQLTEFFMFHHFMFVSTNKLVCDGLIGLVFAIWRRRKFQYKLVRQIYLDKAENNEFGMAVQEFFQVCRMPEAQKRTKSYLISENFVLHTCFVRSNMKRWTFHRDWKWKNEFSGTEQLFSVIFLINSWNFACGHVQTQYGNKMRP